jgi:hypothetical protein
MALMRRARNVLQNVIQAREPKNQAIEKPNQKSPQNAVVFSLGAPKKSMT